MNNHIVIIGGMGPQASIQLHQLIVKGDGTYLAPDEFPTILHISLPVPDFIASSEATDAAVELIQNACRTLPLESAGAIGIACNTAHLLLDRLDAIPRNNFVSMIDAVADDISKAHHKKVGLLASPFTTNSHLYHEALEKRGIEVIQPSRADIEVLNSVIHDIIGGVEPTLLRPKLTKIAKKLQAKGADCILLGCTELPLVGVESKLSVIDSLSSLANKLLQRVASPIVG